MKITFVNPPSEKGKYEHEHMSIPKVGVPYMAAYLEKYNVDCSIIDAKFEMLTHEEVIERLKKEKPDVVGISAMTAEIFSASTVAENAKAVLPGCTTVIGGAHAISIPKETLEEFPAFDMLVAGEGELTILDLMQTLEAGKPVDNVKGLLYRKDGEIITNPPQDRIDDLDSLPFPAWHKYPHTPPFFYVISTRGCPNHCAFCMTILGKKQRRRSPESVVDEIEWLLDKYKVKEINFLDETFTLHREWTNKLLDLMVERGFPQRMKWIAQTRVDRVDEEIFVNLKRAGCHKIEFGVESGNQEILNIIKKNIKLEQVEDAVKFAKKAGLEVGCSFILGHPFETRETAMDTINFIAKLNPDIVSLGIMVPHPGTKVYEMAVKGEGGYKLTSKNWRDYVKFGGGGLELETLSRHEMEKLQAKAYIYLYLKNFRIMEFFSYALDHRKQAFAAAKKLLLGG
ncbi:radical SAM protein [bacterium]|nr:radical SAM protein [bacterium]